MKRLLVAALAALAGCTTTQTPSQQVVDADRRIDTYRPQMENYLRCGMRQAKTLANSRPNVDPYYIAIAAKDACADERSALIDGIQQAHNPEIWTRMIRIYDRKFEESIISTVVRG